MIFRNTPVETNTTAGNSVIKTKKTKNSGNKNVGKKNQEN